MLENFTEMKLWKFDFNISDFVTNIKTVFFQQQTYPANWRPTDNKYYALKY